MSTSSRSRRSVSRTPAAQPEAQRRRVASDNASPAAAAASASAKVSSHDDDDDNDDHQDLDNEVELLLANAPVGSGHNATYTVDAPFRQSRESEARALDALNKRLDYYIVIMREREKIVLNERAELDKLRRGNAAEMTRLRGEFDAKLQAMRAEYEDRADTKPLKAEVQRLYRVRDDLQKDLAASQADIESANDRLRERSDQLKAAQVEVSRLKDEARLLGSSLGKEQTDKDKTSSLLEAARERATELAKQLAEEQANAHAHQKRVAALTRDLKDLRAEYDTKSREHAEAEASKLERERELRASFGEQLNGMVEEMRVRYSNEIAQLKSGVDEASAEELAEARKEAEDLRAQLAAAKNKEKATEALVLKLKTETTMLTAKVATAETEAETYKANVDELKATLDDREEACDKHRAALGRLEVEYSELIGVKIDINQEIKRYRALLEEEEIRLQVDKAGAGRRDLFAESSPSTAYGDKTNNMIFMSGNVADAVLRLKNGHSEPIELKGFVVKSKTTSFKFPDTVVEPNKIVAVYFGKDAAKRSAGDKANVAFAAPKLSFAKNDAATLVDSYGRNVTHIDIYNN